MRKRVIFLGISLGILVNQFMLYECNKVLSEPNYIYTPVPQTIQAKNDKLLYNPENDKIIAKTENKYDCKIRYGFGDYKDPRNKKLLIYNIDNNSPAQKAGLHPGYEIISINDQKTKRMNGNTIQNLFDNSTRVTLLVKDNSNEKRIYTLSKGQVCVPKKQVDSLFNTYWYQIYTGENIDELYEFGAKLTNISNKLHWATRQEVNGHMQNLNYWISKKIKFKNNYNACKMYDKSTHELDICLSKAVNKLQAEIAHDQELERQRAYLQAQQQMHAQQMTSH